MRAALQVYPFARRIVQDHHAHDRIAVGAVIAARRACELPGHEPPGASSSSSGSWLGNAGERASRGAPSGNSGSSRSRSSSRLRRRSRERWIAASEDAAGAAGSEARNRHCCVDCRRRCGRRDSYFREHRWWPPDTGRPLRARARSRRYKADPSGMLRRLIKEELYRMDGTPLFFPERRAYGRPRGIGLRNDRRRAAP